MAYVIIDEMSTTTLVDDRVVEYFGVSFPSQEYTMKFASQDCELHTAGKLVTGLKVRGALQKEVLTVPEALSCSSLADNRLEVATPSMLENHPLICQFARYFPDFDHNAHVLLLLGRDCPRAFASESLTTIEPYVHRTPLGYAVVGSICANNPRIREKRVLRTHVSPHVPVNVTLNFIKPRVDSSFDTFCIKPDDEELALSMEEKVFLCDIKAGVRVAESGHIELPMSVKLDSLPDNYTAARARTANTLNSLMTQPAKLEACVDSMRKSIENGFVEQIPISEVKPPHGSLVWYLPIFCVQQEAKGKYRLVYDAAAKYGKMCLNDALRSGPNLLTQLRHVLLRFREKPVGFGADIKSMFNNFLVPPNQRNMLRFFWFEDNVPGNRIVPYWALSHVFGCTSSPAVASFGLKYCAAQLPDDSANTRAYIESSFYVDDGFSSCDEVQEAVTILQETTDLLARFNMKLHKIVSNSVGVMEHFPSSAKEAPTILPTDSSGNNTSTLGVSWDTASDEFTIVPNIPSRPFTKRDILSMINSL